MFFSIVIVSSVRLITGGSLSIFFIGDCESIVVGSSLGITPILCNYSKIILMITMFIGRVGPLTLLAIWSVKNKKNIIYPKENIIIG